MTNTMFLDDIELEAADYDGSEGYDDSEDDSESRASDARRRQLLRQRQILARNRAIARSAARGRPPMSTPTSTRAAVAAIQHLDVETKVQDDRFRSAMAAANLRMNRADYAAVGGAAINQFIDSFKAPDNPYFKAALRFSPLLLLAPQRHGTGVEGFLRDPRVIGGAAVAAITVIGENRNKLSAVKSIDVLVPPDIAVGTSRKLIGDAFDLRGHRVDAAIEWESVDPTIATIDPTSGLLTPVSAGTTVITARSDEVIRRVMVTVAAASTAGTAAQVDHIELFGPDDVAVGATEHLIADVIDVRNTVLLDPDIFWETEDPTVADVDDDGHITGLKKGVTVVTAKVDGHLKRRRVTVR